MKKLFTLIAAALMAVSANAAKLNLGAPANNTTQGDSIWYDASTKVITFYTAWSYRPGWWLGTKDLSDYDEVVIEFENADCTIQANIEYASASEDAVLSFQNTDDKNKIVIALDETGKSSVKQIYLQGGDDSEGKSVTFVSCYAQNDAAEPTTVALDLSSVSACTKNEDGTYTYVSTAAWGWDNIWFGGFDASDYDFLAVELAEATDVNFQICINYTEEVDDGANVWLNAGETSGQANLSATGKSSISQIALQTSAAGTVKIKSIYWGKNADATGINTVKAAKVAKNDVYYNLSGQRVAKPSKGLYIQNGKKVLVK